PKIPFAKWAIYSFLLLLMLVLQNTISLHMKYICLVLPAVVVISLNDDTDVGLVLGGIFGLLWDVTSGTIFGYNALMMLIFAFAAQIVASNLIRVKWITNLVTVAAFAAVYQVITYFFFFLVWGNGGAWHTVFRAIFRAGLSSAITGTLLFGVYRLISKKLDSPS
ncbi:MAG: rod shape-determining protein MreD, partial [Clostridia bacterium]|nr:rod shape-determining protein MreD [Clostridia bacterium]